MTFYGKRNLSDFWLLSIIQSISEEAVTLGRIGALSLQPSHFSNSLSKFTQQKTPHKGAFSF